MNDDLLEFADFVGRLVAAEWYEIHQKQRAAGGEAPHALGASAQDADHKRSELDAPGDKKADVSSR